MFFKYYSLTILNVSNFKTNFINTNIFYSLKRDLDLLQMKKTFKN